MTDRGRAALRQSPRRFEVGPSSMTWERGALVIDVNEISGPPVIGRVRGRIRVTPSAITRVELPLTADGTHVWRPFGPVSAVECDLEARGWQWAGHGYFDANFGTRALEQDFAYWTWGRFPAAGGATCFYDATRLEGAELGAAFHFDADGSAREITLPPKRPFRRSLWAVRRETRGDAGSQPRQVMNMLDAPFYSRAAVKTTIGGEVCTGVHEALDLRRFRSPLLKPMLAMRVPRRAQWNFGL
jgi:carotenoid 1,2-hydratase